MKVTKSEFQFEVVQAGDLMNELNVFYKSCDRQTQLNEVDHVVIGRLQSEIVVVVRLCLEDDIYVLRTMQVKDDLQGKGIGRLALDNFTQLLKEQSVERIYCMPYAHLEYFYGLIGFKKIELDQAPLFLQKRFEDFHKRHSDKQVILMVGQSMEQRD